MNNALRIIAFIGWICTAVAGFDPLFIAQLFGANAPLAFFLCGPVAQGLKEIALVIGDLLDDGKRNGSFKLPMWLIIPCFWCFVALGALSLSSCAGYSFAISTPYGEVSNQDGGPISIAPKPITFVVPEK